MRATGLERLSHWTMQYAVKPCAVAGTFVFVAFLWTLLFQHTISYPFLFLFFGAVMGSAWFGGVIAGLLAVGLSSLLIVYFFVSPLFSLSVAQPARTYMASFILCAIAMSLVISAWRRSESAVREARDQLELKVQERTAELHQANLELQQSGQRLRTLTEAIPQQMWSSDAGGNIEYCNQHLIDYIGAPIEGLLGEAFFDILHPVDERVFRQVWFSALAAGDKFEVEARVLGVEGVYRWFLIRSIPQRSDDGAIARWYGIHIDIEQQHRAQRGLIAAQDELSRLSRTLSMGELAASIAHELNQPLTALVTNAYACREWLRSSPANLEKATATADKIIQESTRAGAVVERVRSLFQKEAVTREFTDLNRLICDLAQLLREEAIRQNVAIKLVLDENLPCAELDQIQIQQVILNLAANGMDAMANASGKRELTISSELQEDGVIHIMVEDRGAGLPPEVAARIFEPFYSTKPHGTGMGLAICRSIVEAHDGRIWASRSARGGTVMHFTIRTQS